MVLSFYSAAYVLNNIRWYLAGLSSDRNDEEAHSNLDNINKHSSYIPKVKRQHRQ